MLKNLIESDENEFNDLEKFDSMALLRNSCNWYTKFILIFTIKETEIFVCLHLRDSFENRLLRGGSGNRSKIENVHSWYVIYWLNRPTHNNLFWVCLVRKILKEKNIRYFWSKYMKFEFRHHNDKWKAEVVHILDKPFV